MDNSSTTGSVGRDDCGLSVDAVLDELRQELIYHDVDATGFAKLWIGVGLEIAAQIVEDRRIAILCDVIANS